MKCKHLVGCLLLAAIPFWYMSASVSQRHDAIQQLVGPLDEIVVDIGLISDYHLHLIGNKIGVCDEQDKFKVYD